MDAIKKRIFWLLDNKCGECEKVKGKTDHYQICQPCPIYNELKELGTHLDDPKDYKARGRREPKMDLETYIELKREGWTEREIAEDQEISLQTLHAYKKRWGLPVMKHGGDRSNYFEELMMLMEGNTCQTT